ncbi:MAG: PAAR domain-containing protein [Rhizobiaceae bacterium]|nr:PAAR domain-containing protein [Rhizobiaceae bacterium]
MKKCTAVLFCFLAPALAFGQDIPGCALTGSKTVMIGGKPALRLSDVTMCPPDTYEIISSVRIDGQPMVHFKPVHFGKTRCAVMGDSTTVTAEGKTPGTLSATHCSTN